MDTTRITEPITDHLPVAGAAALAAAVADATTDLADQLASRVSDLDLADKAGRTRRTIAGAVPWLPIGETHARRRTRLWLFVGLGVAAMVAAAVVWRRRSDGAGDDAETPARDDWSTHSANGANPPVATSAARETTRTGG